MPKTEAVGNAWRPDAGLEVLKIRATLLARIRSFFGKRGVLEVDTPMLSRFAATDPALDPFQTSYSGPGGGDELALYLLSSPEFFMKRLLAAGSGSIYQLAHVFRNGEYGRRHNPDFMMLEWYREAMDHHALMDEIDALLAVVLEGFVGYRPARRITYRQWFLEATGLDPWRDDVEAFQRFAQHKLGSLPVGMETAELDAWLDLLVTHWLEPRTGEAAVFVYDYPVSQAALARVRHGEVPAAERFELYIDGVELANGFHELADAAEQRRRFENDNRVREQTGRERLPVDEHLLAALQSGLPGCSGVALGFDRLVMLAAGLSDVASAMPFSFQRV
ncbi:EF-P lysine aminoacylase EpmA [Thiogranum longum]